MARDAARESKGDPTELVLALDRRVRQATGDFESFPLSIVRDENLLVTVSGPYVAFRRSIVDLLRTGRAIAQAEWNGTVAVDVAPRRLESPDIDTVEVSRDGKAVAPVRTGLRSMTFSNGTGGERQLHAGLVHFPVAAFAPGAAVTLSLRAVGAEPITYHFSESELSTLR